jgi:5-formyltetrahydrofolate cyclo-ligase
MTYDKASIRKQFKLKRASLKPDFMAKASYDLISQFNFNHLLDNANNIAVYLSHQNEMDLSPLIEQLWAAGKVCYLPVLHSENELVFVPYNKDTHLRPNKFNILEPEAKSSRCKTAAELDIILMPLLAFDTLGNRLGMGKGYYDKSLASIKTNAPPILVGIAYQFQYHSGLPTDSWDRRLDYAVTEQNTYDFRNTHD